MEKKSKIKKYILYLVTMFVLVGLDQLVKKLSVIYLKGNNGITIIPNVFRLYYLENQGAAFGVFQGQQALLLIFTIIVLAGVAYLITKVPEQKKYKPLIWVGVFIIAGAIGNMIDRLLYKYVVDMFYFELINFPVFNVADCYVTVSFIVLFILVLFVYKDDELEFIFPKRHKKGE